MNLRKKAISGGKWTTISKVALSIIMLIKLSVLTRFLDSKEFGLMALVNFVLGFMSLFMDLGFTSAILHKQDISRKEYSSLYWMNIFLSAILFFVISFSSPLIASYYQEEDLKYLIPLMSISLIITAIGRQFRVIEQKELFFKKIATTDIISALIGLFLAIYLAINEYGVLTLIYSILVQYIIANLFFFIRGVRIYGLLFHFRFSETKEFLKIGMYQLGGQIVNYFNRDIDILLVGKLLGSEVLGLYSLAKQLVTYPMSVINPITLNVASPILAKIQNNSKDLKNKYLLFVNLISTVNFIVYMIFIVFASLIVQILYGTKFLEITFTVQILSIYMYLRSINSPVGSLVIATGKTFLEFYWNLLVLFLLPVAVVIGLNFGVIGVSLGLTIMMFLLTFLCWYFLVKKMIDISLFSYLLNISPNFKFLLNVVKNDVMNKTIKNS